jgi:hypothetical protein
VVATLDAVDVDAGDTFSFALIDDPSGGFEIGIPNRPHRSKLISQQDFIL